MTFSQQHRYDLPDAEITIRNEAPSWLRDQVLLIAKEIGFRPSKLREMLCFILIKSPDDNNWSEFPNIDKEVSELLANAPWFSVYDFIEKITEALPSDGSEGRRERFTKEINRVFAIKGIGWKLTDDGKIKIRGEGGFEYATATTLGLTTQSMLEVAHSEMKNALLDISKRPNPGNTGAIQHSIAALECVARHLTGEPQLTLGKWISKNKTVFPSPLAEGLEKFWGYASNNGRHVQEGHPPSFEEAELIVGVSSVLITYLIRKTNPS
jgi:hypothetical protein